MILKFKKQEIELRDIDSKKIAVFSIKNGKRIGTILRCKNGNWKHKHCIVSFKKKENAALSLCEHCLNKKKNNVISSREIPERFKNIFDTKKSVSKTENEYIEIIRDIYSCCRKYPHDWGGISIGTMVQMYQSIDQEPPIATNEQGKIILKQIVNECSTNGWSGQIPQNLIFKVLEICSEKAS